MKNLRRGSWLLLVLACACSPVRHWREMETEPMSLGAAWDGFVQTATARGQWRTDYSATDRGNGKWQSRWRQREKERHFPIRNRIRMELLVDDGSRERGWVIRYMIEQEKVEDLRRHSAPQEDDWEGDGQDSEGEAILGQRLLRRLAPKTVGVETPTR